MWTGSGCDCLSGYVRSPQSGVCVAPSSLCGENEQWNGSGCDCVAGTVRYDGICVDEGAVPGNSGGGSQGGGSGNHGGGAAYSGPAGGRIVLVDNHDSYDPCNDPTRIQPRPPLIVTAGDGSSARGWTNIGMLLVALGLASLGAVGLRASRRKS